MPGLLPHNEDALIELISNANRVRDGGANETVIRQTLIDGLATTFSAASRPWWVERHIRGAEQYLLIGDDNQESGYADSVVGLTAIEYESDLRDLNRFRSGEHQVRQYCTGLLNTGADPAKVRGVLSDGVEWRAYALAAVPQQDAGSYRVADIELTQLGRTLTCDEADTDTARKLLRFWEDHLGRSGARPLTASSVADYLDLDSGFGRKHLARFTEAVRVAFEGDPGSESLIRHVWSRFVAHLSPGGPAFDVDTYVQEFYLVTLARLMCANVIEQRAMHSDDAEIDEILDGRYFEAKGLRRFVEDDYFGWLARPAHIHRIRPFARQLQADLAAYDFSAAPADDLFGGLLAAMATRTQRVLLGQEMTPKALADAMADALLARLGTDERPRFVDMCCGSGTMLVAVAEKTRERLRKAGVEQGTPEHLDHLVEACTGFDIDPLAVVLAKANWVQTNRSALEPFDGARAVTLPVFQADSLFEISPVFGQAAAGSGSDAENDDGNGEAPYWLRLFDRELALPKFLIRPERRVFFDALLRGSEGLSRLLAERSPQTPPEAQIGQIMNDAVNAAGEARLDPREAAATHEFLRDLIVRLADLERDGRDGVWAFAIRNAYWPQLVAGQFNGIISNPPWLAMSKVEHNPFGPALRKLADRYGLKPWGAAAPHLEMATVFLAHSLGHYLVEGGHVACVLPDTIRNGTQHNRFRERVSGRGGTSDLKLRLDEMWSVRRGTFKNRAIVVIGSKDDPQTLTKIPGHVVPGVHEDAPHFVQSADRLVWSHSERADGVADPYRPSFAMQGADIMPRRLLFFGTAMASGRRATISSIRRGSSDWFLVGDAKKHTGFEITQRTIPDRFVHSVYLSKHLAPFALAPPSPAVLPLMYRGFAWHPASLADISIDSQAQTHFEAVVEESDFESIIDWWDRGLDMRHKLSQQSHISRAWIVVYGAGGGIPAAAHFYADHSPPVIIDQTLYWAACDSEEEALYFAGMINSSAVLERIDGYIPAGAFGDRHLHTLPARAIPEYDPASVKHAAVAAAVDALVTELRSAAGSDPSVATAFTTSVSMRTRRSRLRAALRELIAWDAYENACGAVY